MAKKAKKVAATQAGGLLGKEREKFLKNMKRHKDAKTAGGNAAVDNGDKVATKLRGKDLDAVYAHVAKAIREDVKDLKKRYGHLNVGMQRMNLGNRLRAA